jgi:hypothetical protein
MNYKIHKWLDQHATVKFLLVIVLAPLPGLLFNFGWVYAFMVAVMIIIAIAFSRIHYMMTPKPSTIADKVFDE